MSSPPFSSAPLPKKPGHCDFYVSFEQPRCGEPGVAEVPANPLIQKDEGSSMVTLCDKHAAHMNRVAAQMRTRRRDARRMRDRQAALDYAEDQKRAGA